MFEMLDRFFAWLGLAEKVEEPKAQPRDANGRFVSKKKK